MKVACIQMDMMFANPDENFRKAEILINRAIEAGADTVVLPETWNTGFFPKENLKELADHNGSRTKAVLGGIALEKGVNPSWSGPSRKRRPTDSKPYATTIPRFA